MTIDVWRVRVQALERLMHNLYFRLKEFVFFVCFAAVVVFALEALNFACELALGMLGGPDIFDC